MQYFRCKCGSVEHWSSGMGPFPCDGCAKCGTNVAGGPDEHQAPEPHNFDLITQVETDDGPKPLTRCRWCLKTPKEIETLRLRIEAAK